MDDTGWAVDGIDALVFDVIGTLVDEDSAWAAAADRLAAGAGLTGTADLLAQWTRLLQEEMDAVVQGVRSWRPHRDLVVDSAREAVARAGGKSSAAALAEVAALDSTYPAWPDVAPATAALRRDRLVAGLSNGDPDALARLAHTNVIGWDIVLSTGAVRTFKPAPAAYRFAVDALRIDPGRTLFVAAHPWDLRGAAAHGFRTAYVARPGAKRSAAGDRFDLAVDDLSALARILEPPPTVLR